MPASCVSKVADISLDIYDSMPDTWEPRSKPVKKLLLPLLLLGTLALSGCSRLDSLTWDVNAEQWLATHAHQKIAIGSLNFILAEPSSTIIVYGLGIIILLAGLYFLKNRGTGKSRFWWGIALVIWAVSTFSAGTSYQALSYELKYAGRTIGLWTTWWEIWYLLLFVVAMNAITVAVAFSSSSGKTRKGIIGYAAASASVYSALVLTGAFLPNQFLVSFEFMVLFASPTFLILLTVNIAGFVKTKRPLELLLAGAWIFMLLIVAAYFGFYVSGYAAVLWARGIWFNENDVLHIGLIVWIFYLVFAVSKKVEDAS